ncbi:MAG: enoyl-CoA hydratase-related protein [Bacillota bacterium]|nr:enoyl-CoA hydratase-related protein [Bacillota bacterium]
MNEAKLVKIENEIGFIRLNRPEKLNSLSSDLVESFTHNLESFGKNEKVEVIIASGERKGFCAGGDLEKMKNLSEANVKLEYKQKASALTKTILNLDKYVVSLFMDLQQKQAIVMRLSLILLLQTNPLSLA